MGLRTTMGRVLTAGVLVVLVAAASACSTAPADGRAVHHRADAEPAGPTLPGSDTLAATAAERAAALCAAGHLEPDPSAYRQETWADVAELVGRGRSRDEVRAGWEDDDAVERGDWDRTETASVDCPDGHLYAVQVLARHPERGDAGDHHRIRHPASAVEHTEDVRYGAARDVTGRRVDLLLDLFRPPAGDDGSGRPTLVLVHGGGFVNGSRAQHVDDAIAWARRGFVVATIDYRVDPDARSSPAAHRAAGFAAVDDGMEAVRWLRAHAAEHDIDPDRIAALGASAGGSIALGLALQEDAAPGGPHDDISAQVTAAFSTGAHLTPIRGVTAFDAGDAPVLVHHFETDNENGRSWTYAAQTCAAIRTGGGTCDLSLSEGEGHVVGLGPDSARADEILAFLGVHLRLDDP